MTMTINSGSAAYCSPAIFCSLFDYRTFAQLASDTDVPLASSAALQASSILALKLQVAAGKIEMACTKGQRYDPADLALMASGTTNGAAALADLNAGVAVYEMFGRRFETMPDEIRDKVESAMAQLEALADGEEILPFAQTQLAGLIQDYNETPQDVQNRNLPSFVARRCLGRRDNRLPYPNEG